MDGCLCVRTEYRVHVQYSYYVRTREYCVFTLVRSTSGIDNCLVGGSFVPLLQPTGDCSSLPLPLPLRSVAPSSHTPNPQTAARQSRPTTHDSTSHGPDNQQTTFLPHATATTATNHNSCPLTLPLPYSIFHSLLDSLLPLLPPPPAVTTTATTAASLMH